MENQAAYENALENVENLHVKISEGSVIPENMHILFSGWLGLQMDNRHGFPEAHPVFESGTPAPEGTLLCTGNCTECLKEDRLCRSVGKGQATGFLAH